MHDMEKGVRYADSSGGVIKKKNSSGCLIIKKKGDGVGGLGLGFGASTSKKVFDSKKEKKRPRLILSDSESNDELLEPVRRKVVPGTDKFRNGSVVYKNGSVEDNFIFKNGQIESERKRSGVDTYEFDESNGHAGKKMRGDYMDDRLKLVGPSGNQREFGIGPSRNVMADKVKRSYFDSTSSMFGGKSKGPIYTVKNRHEMEDDAHRPISLSREKYREASDEPIRLQGKNGVLKVMVNKQKKLGLYHKSYDHQEAEDRKRSRSEDAVKKNVVIPLSFYSDLKYPEKRVSVGRTEKSELKLRKSLSTKRSKAGDSETDDSDASLKLGSMRVEACISTKTVGNEGKITPPTENITQIRGKEGKVKKMVGNEGKITPPTENITPIRGKEGKVKKMEGKVKKMVGNEGKITPPTENITPVRGKEGKVKKIVGNEGKITPLTENITAIRGKEGKVKRGSGTEKQLLREKIRSMLLNSGWTIDYRPRRNRDYLDAVYINPAGTAYWSIIKAYDALQKQLEEEDNDVKPCRDSSPFTPLAEETLSKLTRQTRKKIEREMKKKRRDDGDSKNAKKATVEESADGTDNNQHKGKLSFYMKQDLKSRIGRLHEADHASGDDSSDNLYKRTAKQGRVEKTSTATNSPMIQGRKSGKFGRCTLLVRNSNKGLNSETDVFVPYTGKRTVLSWLIDSGIVHMSEKVQYLNRRKSRVMLEGWITRDGIHCICCSKILTTSKFEIHAGSKQRLPFPNIFLESGSSLMQCQVDAWNRQEEYIRRGFHTVDIDGDDPNDDTCGLCADGGDLICCDSCPSTFHLSCLDIQMLPPGDWHCPNCRCKFCGIGGIAEANGRTVSALLMCSLCEKKYHESCSLEKDDLPVDSNDASTFCGHKCRELFGHLQKLLGVKHELEAGYSWSLIHRMDPFDDMLHLGFPQRVECNSKLAVALSVMDECFLPIVDRRSGINLIHSVVYNCGSNISRLNYSRFYTAILERGDEIISAASIRIHGNQLAEMPFIGTRHIYRRRGMCRRLLCAIESVLCSLKVEKLIIPAIVEHMHTWTKGFNFNPLEELHKQEMRSMNMLVFPGIDMLQKLLVEREIREGNITANSDAKSIEVKENHLLLPVLAQKSELDSSAGHDFHTSDHAGVQHVNEINENFADTDSGLQAPAVPSKDSNVMSNYAEPPCEPKLQSPSKETISINSQSVNKLEEPTADLKCLSPSSTSPVILEIGNHVLDSPVKDNNQSSAEGVAGDAHEVSAKASRIGSVLDSLGETSARNVTEETNKNENLVSVSTFNGTNEKSTMQLHFNLNHHSEVEMKRKLCATPEVASDAEIAHMEGNTKSFQEGSERNVHEVDVKIACVGPLSGSSLEISTLCLTDEGSIQFKSDLNHQTDVESQLPVGSECGSEAKIASVESNIQSSAVGDIDDESGINVNVSVEPVGDSFRNISAKNTAEEINENQNPISLYTFRGTEEQISVKVESKIPVASKVVSDGVVAPADTNIQPIGEDEVDNAHEVNAQGACFEPVLDSLGETSALNSTIRAINGNPIV